jgi:parvulin-like peptidyl-prolyl isomerase
MAKTVSSKTTTSKSTSSKTTAKSSKALSKKHLARIEKERRQNKILTIGTISIVAIIAILVLVSQYNTKITDWYKATFVNDRPAAKVGDTVITVGQFEHRVKYERYQLVSTYITYASSYFASFFQSQLLEVQNQLDDTLQFGSDVLDNMISEQALVLKAKQMGITVTDEEVEAEIRANLSYFPSGTPNTPSPSATITYYPTSTLSAAQNTLTFKTPTPLPPTATPLTTEAQQTLDAQTPTPTETLTPTPTEDLTPTVQPSPTATATVFTYNAYTNLYSTVVAGIQTNSDLTETELREYIRTILYERKVYAKLAAGVSASQDMVWARHILVKDEATAKEVLAQLKAGGDWNTICLNYSTDTGNNTTGGDLGWFTKGTMVTAFEDAAWALKIGAFSEPIKTDYGYHIIQVLGHEKRQLTADQLSTAQNAAYTKFIEDAKTEFGVTKYDIWARNIPVTPAIPDEYKITSD